MAVVMCKNYPNMQTKFPILSGQKVSSNNAADSKLHVVCGLY